MKIIPEYAAETYATSRYTERAGTKLHRTIDDAKKLIERLGLVPVPGEGAGIYSRPDEIDGPLRGRLVLVEFTPYES